MAMNARLLRPLAGFDPRSIGGLELWLDASDVSTVTLNSTTVSEWRSKVGGRILANGTAGEQPIYSLGFQNGRNALQFDAARRLVSTQAAADWKFYHAEKTVTFAVWRVATGNAARFVASTFPVYNAAAIGVSFYHDMRTTSVNRVGTDSPAGSNNYAWANTLSGQTADVARAHKYVADTTIAGNTSTESLQRMVVSSNTSSATNAAGIVPYGNPSTANPTGTLVIGAQNATGALTFPYSGYIMEWLTYRGESCRTAEQQNAVQAYLVAKWGL